jgi:hypothetical protein
MYTWPWHTDMKLLGIFDPKTRAERTRLKLIAKKQAQFKRVEGTANSFAS